MDHQKRARPRDRGSGNWGPEHPAPKEGGGRRRGVCDCRLNPEHCLRKKISNKCESDLSIGMAL